MTCSLRAIPEDFSYQNRLEKIYIISKIIHKHKIWKILGVIFWTPSTSRSLRAISAPLSKFKPETDTLVNKIPVDQQICYTDKIQQKIVKVLYNKISKILLHQNKQLTQILSLSVTDKRKNYTREIFEYIKNQVLEKSVLKKQSSSCQVEAQEWHTAEQHFGIPLVCCTLSQNEFHFLVRTSQSGIQASISTLNPSPLCTKY